MGTAAGSGLGSVVSLQGDASAVPEGSAPTTYAAYAVVTGEKGAVLRFGALTLLRTLIIAPGLLVAGIRGKQLLLGSLYSSSLISVSAVAYCYALKQSAPKTQG